MLILSIFRIIGVDPKKPIQSVSDRLVKGQLVQSESYQSKIIRAEDAKSRIS